ncbi:hypothetical protein [Pyruvatibacter sp.]|uniref:hypothetical protein n=1 Tax=unclassified Pyruvatibacter TaxID=2618840 RepID=UPI0029690FBA|nr:hypothetical protein [Alphaproteobacteria bacterium]
MNDDARSASEPGRPYIFLQGRRVAWLDLWLFTPLALPYFSEIYITILKFAHFQLGLAGGFPGFAPLHWVFINTTGILAVLWACIRLRYPVRDFALADAYARIVVAAILVFWIWQGATPLLTLFVATEIGGALYVVWPRKAV